jgi:flavin-dependent dehydrogenase
MEQPYDVAIIGGGPAGSTAGTFLARNNRRVIILEKERFPRFRVGESTVPGINDVLDRLGVRSKIDRGDFLVKFGGEIVAACGSAKARFYFRDGWKSRHETAYQVERSKFDEVLLQHSRESGCEVRQPLAVERITLAPEEVLLHSGAEAIRARYVIDCSGRNSLIANHLGLRSPYPQLRKFSVFAFFKNVLRELDEEGTMTRMIRGCDAWFWMIPLTGDKCSVGVVMDLEQYRSLKLSPEAVLQKCIAEQPEINRWMREAVRCTPVYATSDFSYHVSRLSGDRWLLAGDAAGFLDPVFSNGVYLAFFSGEMAALAVEQALANPARARKALQKYDRIVQARFKSYLKLVRAWYTDEFIEIFLRPRPLFNIVPIVNAVLSGNPGESFEMRWRMMLFYLLVFLQGRTGKLVPELTFKPQGS